MSRNVDNVDMVLADYAEAMERGDARLEEWVVRYPEYRTELAQYAAYEMVFERGVDYHAIPAEEEAEALVRASSLRSRLWPEAAACAPIDSLVGAAKAVGISQSDLARRLRLGVSMVVKLERRLFRAAYLPLDLVEELATVIGRSVDEVAAYVRRPPALSTQASYKSMEAPRLAEQEEFATALETAAGLSDEDRAYWRTRTDRRLGETD